jgi:hypothetical protein
MDPITLAIVSALTVGVASGVTDISKKAIVDGYEALKAALKRKFGAESKVAKAVVEVEANPDSKSRPAVLNEEVVAAKADQDQELLSVAKALIEALQSTAEGKQALGKYQIDARYAQIGVMGDQAKVEGGIHFGEPKTESETAKK